MDSPKQPMTDSKPIYILHLSDIHFGTVSDARKYLTQLATDLKNELKVSHLGYIVISGDIATKSIAEEYDAAIEFTTRLMARFGLDATRMIVVPGNHDVNWDLGAQAYDYVPHHRLANKALQSSEHLYIPAGDAGALVRNEERYQKRFQNFDLCYRRVCGGTPYPLDFSKQSLLHAFPDDRILFLALNSCWQIDHYHRQRSGINMEALSNAIDYVMDLDCDDWLKIAVLHHPTLGLEAVNREFLELLAVHGFRVCLHGHIHEASEGFYKYDSERGLHIVTAGTFGAPVREQVPGIPLQYNLLEYDTRERVITVRTRKKEKPDGAWSADARWGDKTNPLPWYGFDI